MLLSILRNVFLGGILNVSFPPPYSVHSSLDIMGNRFGRLAKRGLAVGSLCVVLCSSAHGVNLTLTTEEYPPFNMSDPQSKNLIGIAVDKVVELMRRAEQPYSLSIYPWTRAYQMALQRENVCVFSTTRTPEREALFKWVGPLVTNDWMVFARADDKRQPKTLEDLRPFVLGGYHNDATSEFLKINGFMLDLVTRDADNPHKLLRSRFDFWATGELMGHYLIKSNDLKGKIVPRFVFKHAELYLACNIKMSDQKIGHLNQVLDDMTKDGTNEAILLKYK